MMVATEGSFVWYELITSDVVAAQNFYSKVVGWTMADAGMPGMPYTLAKVGERQIAGVMGFPPDMDAPKAAWRGYILATDVDATAKRVEQAGGAVHRAPMDIPNVGRFAVVADPQGAVFMLFRGDGTPAPDLAPGAPGSVGWHELLTRDWEQAFAFYQGLFGWEKAETVDMGPMGIYQTFSTGDVPVGGMMNVDQAPIPTWRYYFNVENIAAAAARVTDAGGTVTSGPHEVPGGSWIVQASDPQGVTFALAGPRG